MFESSNPKQRYLVINRVALTSKQERVLIKLYQPLVASLGVAVYQTLIEEYDPFQMLADAPALYFLQEQLDCSLGDLFKALHKLEAVGLLTTYLSENVRLGQLLAFKLKEVPEASEFFNTSLLASLLKEKVGSYRFSRLSQDFANQAKREEKQLQNLRDVSASFFEVFRLPDEEAITPSAEVQQAAQENEAPASDAAQVNVRQVDWQFLKDCFAVYHIDPSEIDRQKDQIQAVMATYGLSEQEFVDESLPSLHGTSKLDVGKIGRSLTYNYKANHRRQQVKNSLAKSEGGQVSVDQRDRQLLQLAKSKAPAQFLNYMKDRKGGFTTKSEYQVINDLSWKVGFSPEMLNILIYTCLHYQPVLSLSLAERIANDWMQHKLATPEAALAYIRQRSQNKQTTTRYYGPRQVEKGTDWSKKQAEQVDVTPEQLAALLDDEDEKKAGGKPEDK